MPAHTAPAVAATNPPPRTWCRVAVQVSLVPPAPGQLLLIDRSERTIRAVICAPRPLLVAFAVAVFGNHPWVVQGVLWAKRALGW